MVSEESTHQALRESIWRQTPRIKHRSWPSQQVVHFDTIGNGADPSAIEPAAEERVCQPHLCGVSLALRGQRAMRRRLLREQTKGRAALEVNLQ
mmetsp:Transcript_42453/g.100755  ORF Transcript_42453/g.100755 Transcript_42453/m.100755 type:complete len:94 (-) Transcript_42453:126-407(-)